MEAVPTRERRILVVEDDREIREMLRKTLSRRYTVVVAEGGVSGLLLAKKSRPDLLLLDVMLPGASGFELAEAIRKEPDLKRVPLIFLTAKDTTLDTIKGIQAGARHYITKPFALKDLMAKIEKILG